MADSDYIPKRSRQATIPFCANLNQSADGGEPAIFTYRKNQSLGDASVDLGIYPDSYDIALADDISIQHLYPLDESGHKSKKEIKMSHILNFIPAITIREYIPDTRLNQVINYMSSIYGKLTGLFETSKDGPQDNDRNTIEITIEKAKSFFKKIPDMAIWAFKYITGTDECKDSNLWTSLNVDAGKQYGNEKEIYANIDADVSKAIYDFPFTLYYLFQSSLTTNIYEFPCILPDGRLYASSGHEGWTAGSNEISLMGMLGKIPLVNTFLKSTLNNVSVAFMPWWDAESGRKTIEPDVNVKFHLFNDNLDKAIANFLCVNTLIANNRWYQYKFYQHSPALYEIKLEGSNRLFACTCNSIVRSIGNLRQPPARFAQEFEKYCSSVADAKAFATTLLEEKVIKIPDVYEVELTFKSILPANFNNFMYQYSAPTIVKESYRDTAKAITDSLGKTLEDFKEKAKAKFNSLG